MAGAKKTAQRPPKKVHTSDSLVRFSLAGEPYEINPEALTFGEMADIEQALDVTMDELEPGSATSMMAMIYVAVRRKRPDFTIEEVRAMAVSDLTGA